MRLLTAAAATAAILVARRDSATPVTTQDEGGFDFDPRSVSITFEPGSEHRDAEPVHLAFDPPEGHWGTVRYTATGPIIQQYESMPPHRQKLVRDARIEFNVSRPSSDEIVLLQRIEPSLSLVKGPQGVEDRSEVEGPFLYQYSFAADGSPLAFDISAEREATPFDPLQRTAFLLEHRIPPEPVRPGDRWIVELPLPGDQEARRVSTFVGTEETSRGTAAVIESEMHLQLTGVLGETESVGRSGRTARYVCREGSLTEESRLTLVVESGLPVSGSAKRTYRLITDVTTSPAAVGSSPLTLVTTFSALERTELLSESNPD